MLIVSRKPGQEIIIGKAGDVLTEPIKIMCLGERSGGLRIGVHAQDTVFVRRKEIQDDIDNGAPERRRQI